MPGSSHEEDGVVRTPHINLMVLAIGLTRRLVTTVFFSEAADPVLQCVPEGARRRLVAVQDPALDAGGLPAYRFDVVLRGENETPFFLD
jgi:protocatechuate 3,4-dioxygenase beta subunit